MEPYERDSYLAVRAAFTQATSSLLARLDGCQEEAKADPCAVKPASRQPQAKERKDT